MSRIQNIYFFLLTVEWTQISTRYLREQLAKISDFYHLASSGGDGPVPVEVEQAMQQWEYNEKLAFHMFQVTSPRHAGCGACLQKESSFHRYSGHGLSSVWSLQECRREHTHTNLDGWSTSLHTQAL